MHSDQSLLTAVIGNVDSNKSDFIGSCLDPAHHRIIQNPKTCITYKSIVAHGQSVTLIDTPGFDNKNVTFEGVLAMIKAFLEEMYEEGRELDGLLYVHHELDMAMGGVHMQNFDRLQKFFGMNPPSKDLIVTHMWNEATVGNREPLFRNSHLYFLPILDLDSKEEQSPRYDTEAAQSILRHLIEVRPITERLGTKDASVQKGGEIHIQKEEVANADQEHVWNATSRLEVLQILRGNQEGVLTVTFSPDGKRLASGSLDSCRVWDVSSGAQVLIIMLRSVRSVKFSPDGTRIVTGSDDGTVRVFDVASSPLAELVTIQAHWNFVYAVDFSPDGDRVVSSAVDKAVHIWDATSGDCLLTLHGHTTSVWSVVFSPDGTRIVSGSDDKSVRVWDADSGVSILTPLGDFRARITSVACSPDGTRIAAGTHDGTIRVWEAASGVEVFETLRGKTYVLSVAFSPDGKWLVSGSSDYIVRVWDASSGIQVLEQNLGSGAQGAIFSPDGMSIAVGRADGTVCIWGKA